MSMSAFAAVGPMFTALDMLVRYSAAYDSVEPSIDRLKKRLENLSFLLRSIHELKPKHLALSDLFRSASKHVTEDLMVEFGDFLNEYGRPPKEHKQKYLRKLVNATDKVKKFVLSTRHEGIIRRVDEAVSKVVAEVNTLLQVEEMYNLNNMSDSMRAVLANLKEIPEANEQLVREMEMRVLGNLKVVRDQLSTSNNVIKGLNANVTLMAKDLAAIHQRLDALPKYLRPIKSTEIRDLWRHREWPDCIPFGHFSRAIDEFVDYTFAGLGRPVQRRIVARLCTELKTRVVDQSHGGSDYLAASDLDKMIPPESQFIDYVLAIEFGWMLYLRYLMERLQGLADSHEAHPAKTKRLIADLHAVLDPLAEAFEIDAQYVPDVVVNVERNSEYYRPYWSPAALAAVAAIEKVNVLLGAVLTGGANAAGVGTIVNGSSAGSNGTTTTLARRDLFTLSRTADSEDSTDTQVYAQAHVALASNAPTLFAELDVASLAPAADQLSAKVHDADIASDNQSNKELSAQFEVIHRNLARCLEDPLDFPGSTPAPTPQQLAQIYVKIGLIARLAPINISGLINTFTGTYHGIPVLVHPTGLPCHQDLPDDLVHTIQRTRQPHPALLHLLGLGVYMGQWTLVHELPSSSTAVSSVMTLAQYLSSNPNLGIGHKVAIAQDLVSVVDYLHNGGATLGSLCSTSVLVDSKVNIKVIPCLRSGGWIAPGTDVCIHRYAAPEMLAGYASAGPSRELADEWSLGALLMAVLTNNEFLAHVPDAEIVDAIRSGTFTFQTDALPVIGDGSLVQAVVRMVQPNGVPADRTPVEDVDAILEDLIASGQADLSTLPMQTGPRTLAMQGTGYSTTSSTSPTTIPPRSSSRVGSAAPSIRSEYSLPPYEMANGAGGAQNNWYGMPTSPTGNAGHANRHDLLSQAIAMYNGGMGDISRAIPLFEQAYTTYQQYDALQYLGDIYYFGNANAGITPDYPRAYEYYYKATQNGSRPGHIGLGDCYLFNLGLPEAFTKAVRLQQARHHYELAFRDNPNPSARLLCGMADIEYYTSQGDSRIMYRVVIMTDTALHRYQKAAGMEPGYYRAQVGLADCCLARNQIENAKELYLAVAEAMPSLKRVYIGLSLASTDHGDRDSYAVMSEEPGVRDH